MIEGLKWTSDRAFVVVFILLQIIRSWSECEKASPHCGAQVSLQTNIFQTHKRRQAYKHPAIRVWYLRRTHRAGIDFFRICLFVCLFVFVVVDENLAFFTRNTCKRIEKVSEHD
jgi:hypothetical protein